MISVGISERLNEHTKCPSSSPDQQDGTADCCAFFRGQVEHGEDKFMLHGDRAGLRTLDDLLSHFSSRLQFQDGRGRPPAGSLRARSSHRRAELCAPCHQ